MPVECGRRGDAAMGLELPGALPILRTDREYDAVVVREEQAAVADRRWELDEALSMECPRRSERRRERHTGRNPPALGVASERRPGDPRLPWRWGGSLRRDEFDRRRALDVARLVPEVEVVGDCRADEREDDDGGDHEHAAPQRLITA